jgi:hypothetical protein
MGDRRVRGSPGTMSWDCRRAARVANHSTAAAASQGDSAILPGSIGNPTPGALKFRATRPLVGPPTLPRQASTPWLRPCPGDCAPSCAPALRRASRGCAWILRQFVSYGRRGSVRSCFGPGLGAQLVEKARSAGSLSANGSPGRCCLERFSPTTCSNASGACACHTSSGRPWPRRREKPRGKLRGLSRPPAGGCRHGLLRLTLDRSQTYHPGNDERATP